MGNFIDCLYSPGIIWNLRPEVPTNSLITSGNCPNRPMVICARVCNNLSGDGETKLKPGKDHKMISVWARL